MAGQQPPDSASQLSSASTAPALSSVLQQQISAPPPPVPASASAPASGGSGLASSLASGGMPASGAAGTTSSVQATSTAASAPNNSQQIAQVPQQNASNPSSQISGTTSSAQQQNQHPSQVTLSQNLLLAQQILGQNPQLQKQQQQQGRQPQYSQNAQTSSQPQQGASLQQPGFPMSQGQPLQNLPRVSSAQRLLQMQQPGGGNGGVRAPALGGAGAQFNQQLAPSLPASLTVSSPGAVQTLASSAPLQQQQQQQQQLMAQRNFQGQQQQAGTPSQQRGPQGMQQAAQSAQQNQQHTAQSPLVQSQNQSLAQQIRPSLFSPSQQSVASHLGHHMQQPGVAARLGTTSGGAMQGQGQGPGLPSMLPLQQGQPFAGMQAQTQQPALQGLSTMAVMGSAGNAASSSLPSQLSRAATPLLAQQRIQQQRLQQQQQPHQTLAQQQQAQHQSSIPSPSKQQTSQQLPRAPSIGSSGPQMQSIAATVQQSAALLPQGQSWFPAGQMKPNVNPAAPYHSQLPPAQLQAAQQRSQQQQAVTQQPQQQAAASPLSAAQLQLQQSQQVPSQQQQQAAQPLALGPTGTASTPIPPTPPTTAQTPSTNPIPTQGLSQQQQRVQGSAGHRPSTPVGQQLSSVQPTTVNTGPSSHASDPSGKILGKRSIQDLVSQVDPGEKLDPDVEDVILEIADDFVETVTSFACSLAKHRKSTTLEVKDVLLHLERNWHMTIPGFSGDEYRSYKKPSVSESHKHRLALVRKSLASTHPTQEPKSASLTTPQKPNSGPQPAKASQSTGPVTSPKANRTH